MQADEKLATFAGGCFWSVELAFQARLGDWLCFRLLELRCRLEPQLYVAEQQGTARAAVEASPNSALLRSLLSNT
jgi:hypothetical protein